MKGSSMKTLCRVVTVLAMIGSVHASSFDTQLNEARHKIQQYADDQIWLYSVTLQAGSFDTQLNEALSKLRQ